jgi:hypothetical protein
MFATFGKPGRGKVGSGGGSSGAVTPFLDANLVAETYTLNGASLTFGDIFGTPTIDGTAGHVANVGFVCDKSVGAAALQRIQIPFTPAVYALANVVKGFSAIVDYTVSNIVNVVPTIANVTVGLRYFRNAGPGWPLFYTANGGVTDDSTAACHPFTQSQDYDYDNAVGGDNYHPRLDVPFASPTDLKFIGTMGNIIRSYFSDQLSDEIDASAAHAWPHPNADMLQMYMSAAAHHAGDTVNTTVKLTVKRIRLYTPAQNGGWVPKGG